MNKPTNMPMGTASPTDQVRVSVGLAVPPQAAFRAFTEDVNLWWRRGRRFRNAPGDAPGGAGVVGIEPRLHGRVFESFDTEAGEQVVEMGRVLAWEPPRRLLLRWRAVNFAPGEHTEVEVLFEPQGETGTRVTLVHRGWDAIRPDHPVRHGQATAHFLRSMGLWWGDQLLHLRQVIQ